MASPRTEMTDTTENITFLQFRWRAVTKNGKARYMKGTWIFENLESLIILCLFEVVSDTFLGGDQCTNHASALYVQKLQQIPSLAFRHYFWK